MFKSCLAAEKTRNMWIRLFAPCFVGRWTMFLLGFLHSCTCSMSSRHGICIDVILLHLPALRWCWGKHFFILLFFFPFSQRKDALTKAVLLRKESSLGYFSHQFFPGPRGGRYLAHLEGYWNPNGVSGEMRRRLWGWGSHGSSHFWGSAERLLLPSAQLACDCYGVLTSALPMSVLLCGPQLGSLLPDLAF